MTDRLIIEGQVIRHVRETVVSEAPLDSLASRLVTRLPTTFPTLPSAAATRFLAFDPNAGRGLILLEVKPRHHTIQVMHHGGTYPEDAARADADHISRFRVLLPYTYFVFPFSTREINGQMTNFTVDGGSLYWRKDPYRHDDPTLVIAPVPNVDNGGGICWGSTARPGRSLSEHLDALVNEFFLTQFNEDLGHRTPFGTSLTEWERNSQSGLDFLSWPFWDSDQAHSVTMESIWTQNIGGARLPNMADINPSFVEIPPLPEDFTVARAQQWLAQLNPGQRRRLSAAITLNEEPEPMETETAAAAPTRRRRTNG